MGRALPSESNGIAPTTAPRDQATHTLIVSDVHLGLSTSRPGKLLETLRSWQFRRLILLGDIFHDEEYQRFCSESWAFVRYIRELSMERAAEVIWLHGNHDRHLAPIIGTLTGIEVRESFVWTQNGHSYMAVHGDCFDWFNHHFRRLGNLIGRFYALALRLSLGRWLRELDAWHSRVRGVHRKVARRAARFALAQGVDFIVCGHTHRPLKRRFRDSSRGGAVTYVNAGSWVDSPASFLTVDGAGIRINHTW